MPVRQTTWSFLGVVLLACSPAGAQEGVRETRLSVSLERSRAVGGRVLQSADLGLVLHLRERPAGGDRVEAEVLGVRGTVEARMVGLKTPLLVWDSASPGGGPLAPLEATLGRTLTFRRAGDGSVTGLRGGAAAREAVLELAKAQPLAGLGVRSMLENLTAILQDDVLEGALTSLQAVGPPGSAWERARRERLPELGVLVYTARGTPTGQGVSVALAGEARIEQVDPASAGEGARGLRIARAQVEGEAVFSAGRLLRSELRRRIDGTARARGIPARVALLAKATLTYEVLSAPPPKKRYF